MTSTDTDASEGGLRLLTVLEALCGYAAGGAANSELAQAAQTSAPNISRAMRTLTAKGWARKGEDGRFFPTPQFTRLTFAVLDDFARAEQQLHDLKRSMTGR